MYVNYESTLIKIRINLTESQTGGQNTENDSLVGLWELNRVPTRPGKPGKMRVHLENLEISWNFENFNKYHGKTT